VDDPGDFSRNADRRGICAAFADQLADSEASLDRSMVALLRFGERVTAAQYLAALEARRALWTDAQRFLARFDLLLTPTAAVTPFAAAGPFPTEIDGAPVSPLGWMPFTFPWNLTGQPAASVPVGFTDAGLPVGLQIVGRRHGDRAVLAASAAFEAAARPSGSLRPRAPRALACACS
jgi:aspartyl-tRNA(Asn)/glutamyl-tRNA(Gln) amidotransferase subunit A